MASHQDSDSARASGLNILSGRLGTTRKVLVDDHVIDQDGPISSVLDPNGSDRVVTLPSLVQGGGLFYIISNVSVGNVLNVRSANGLDIETILPRQMMMFISSEAEWLTSAGLARAAGPTHRAGQVPDPGPVVQALRFLREDMEWGSVFVSGVVDAYKFMTDGTHTSIGTGPDTFKFRSSNNSIVPTVTNNDPVHGDSVDFLINQAAVDHNALFNYFPDRHIDHTAVVLTAGLGISGGGDIAASRSFALDFSELAVVVPTLADFGVFHDVSAGLPGAATWANINAIFDHNALANFVANKHIDHSLVGITAGIGLSGGGDLTSTRTLNIDFTEFDALDVITSADLIPYYDVSEADHGTVTVAQFNAALDHNSLLNYNAAEHLSASTANLRVIANISGGAALPVANTVTAILDATLSSTRGSVLYRGAAAWAALGPGTNGQFLKTLGAGADPAWGTGNAGDVVGPASATDNAAARFDTATGKLIQDSPLIVADTTAALSRSGNGGIPIQGTNTNDSASAGQIGEVISSAVLFGSAVSLTSPNALNVTSISLTAGDWIVEGHVAFLPTATTSITVLAGGISLTTNTLPAAGVLNEGAFRIQRPAFVPLAGFQSNTVPSARISINATTTVFLVAQATFTVSTLTAYGAIRARRVR